MAVLTVGWAMDRGTVLSQMAREGRGGPPGALLFWVRWVIPVAIAMVGCWWFVTEALPGVMG